MSQASQIIGQQYIDGGVIPGKLAGQDAVSKTYVEGQLTIRDQNISAVSGAIGQTQSELDQLENRVDRIVASAGDSNAEIVDARGGYTVLRARLDAFDTKLTDTILNVKNPPPPFTAMKGDGITDDTIVFRNLLAFAISNKRKLYLPQGVYITDTLEYGVQPLTNQISIEGESRNNTILKKKTLDGHPIFRIGDITGTSFTSGVSISNITFDGIANNTEAAFVTYDLVRSRIENCEFRNCVVGLKFYGGIANTIENCVLIANNIGISFDKFSSQAGGGYPNLNTISSCQIVDNTSWGVWFNNGRFLNIFGCDIENNGVTNATNTGGVYIGQGIGAEGNLFTIGVNIENSWIEANKGISAVQFNSGKNSIANSYFVANTSTYDIHIVGGRYNLFFLDGDTVKESNIKEEATIESGNYITDCEFTGLSYDTNKTTVTFSNGRVITRGGELPSLGGLARPYIQQGLNSSTNGVVNVTFPVPFTANPMIQITMNNDNANSIECPEVYNVSTTGFTIRKKSLTNGTVSTSNAGFYWLAIGSK